MKKIYTVVLLLMTYRLSVFILLPINMMAIRLLAVKLLASSRKKWSKIVEDRLAGRYKVTFPLRVVAVASTKQHRKEGE